ncbi:trichohyalin [Drosophila madeirensis]|uniref:Trichohyalin n=1 Tax=Drosophila madeirensis TaxID=30013 RepID=A0AAU9G5M5_DROMD
MPENINRQKSRRQYGAWDKPGVSLFAVVSQEPLNNMLSMMKPLPKGSSDYDKDAYPMIQKSSAAENAVYRAIKFQVEQLALKRRLEMSSKEEERRINNELMRALMEERRAEVVAKSKLVQLQRNVPELRDLQVEVNVAKVALKVRQQMLAEAQARSVEKQAERDEALAQQQQGELQVLKEKLAADQKAHAYREALMNQIAESTEMRERKQHETKLQERQELINFQKQYALEQQQEADKWAQKRKQLQESLNKTFAQKQAAREAQEMANRVRPQRGILDSYGPTTAAFVAKDMKRRADEMQAREMNSVRLGLQLSKIQHDRSARDELLRDLLEHEYSVKESKRHLEQMLERHAECCANHEKVGKQREEDKYFREQRANIGNDIRRDSTSFGERQHHTYEHRLASMHKKNEQCYHYMEQQAMANEQRRNADAEAARNIAATWAQLQEAQDAAVGKERLRVLRSQPQEVLNAMRPYIFTANKQKVLNLETSKHI